ncbi:MAG: acyltransferase family protein [Clostridia bacterium]
MEKKAYLDELRVFATFCVIVLHVSAGNWGYISVNTNEWIVLTIFNSLVRFSAPIFVMISGALFLNENYDFSLEKLFKKNILKIITAFAFWSTFYALLSYENPVNFVKSIISGHFHMWFLYMIVGLYLALPILRKIAENRQIMLYFLILSFVFVYIFRFLSIFNGFSYVIDVINQKSSINLFLGYSSYFLTGHFLDTQTVNKKNIYTLGVASMFFTIFATIVLSKNTGVPSSEFFSYFMPNVYFSSVFIFVLFKNKVKRVDISKIVQLSFGVYLIHPYVNSLIYNYITTSNMHPIYSVILISCVSFILSNLIIFMISKVQILNKYII